MDPADTPEKMANYCCSGIFTAELARKEDSMYRAQHTKTRSATIAFLTAIIFPALEQLGAEVRPGGDGWRTERARKGFNQIKTFLFRTRFGWTSLKAADHHHQGRGFTRSRHRCLVNESSLKITRLSATKHWRYQR